MTTLNPQEEAWKLEKKLVPQSDWGMIPKKVTDIANEGLREGVPTGIARHEKWGWCVIWSAGQGPAFAYVEHPPEEEASL